MKRNLVFLSFFLTLGGCKSIDTVLDSAERTIRVVDSSTVRGLYDISQTSDPEAALRTTLSNRGESYKDNPALLVSDVRRVKQDLGALFDLLEGNVNKTWGKSESKLPSRTNYVKYTQNYQSRAIVDFDSGVVSVETVDQKDPAKSLKNAIVTTLLTPNDPRSVDLFSANEITLSSDKAPYLVGLVADHRGQNIDSPAKAEQFADYLINNKLERRVVSVGDGDKEARAVTIKMVANFTSKQAEKYRPMVEKYAKQYRISSSLIYAMIRTESNFNPFAVSHAPAYGLMQLVPTSGGREAYRYVTGKRNEDPSREYLFNAENNIELGTAYLSLLSYNHLQLLQNPISREYCVISAYNTGPGNVMRAFSPGRNRVEAVNRINSMEPPKVYDQLRNQLPYEETRHYLHKVVNYRKEFVRFN